MALKCKKCGSLLEKDANFCIVCGENNAPAPQTEPEKKVEQQPINLVQPSTIANPTTPQSQQPVEEPKQPIEEKKEENKAQVVPPPAEQIVVPADAEKDTVVTNLEQVDTSTLQEMPAIEDNNSIDPNKLKINIQNNNPIINRSSVRRRKKSKDAKIVYTIAAIGGSVFLLIILGFIFAFYTSYKEGYNKNDDKSTTLKVGTKEYGYVQIPKTWTRFGNNSGKTLQYTDGTGWIITLFAVPTNQIDAQKWTETIAQQMNNIGAVDINVEQARVDKYSGYKIYGFYNTASTYLSAWVIDGEDGNTHYIAIEGPLQFDETYEIVNTFTIE